MRFSISFAVLAFAGCAATRVSSPDLDAFRFEGKPIHPALLDQFMPSPTDGGPFILAVDVEMLTQSKNHLSNWSVSEEDGWIKGDREAMHGYLEYHHLGIGRNGAHYLEVFDNGGGSATWRYLIQARFEAVEAFGSRRIILRCENVEDLTCCPVRVVEGTVVYGPCDIHPRPIPEEEPPDVNKLGASLKDPALLGTWDSHVVRDNRALGRIRVFQHSIFVERQGSVPFTLLAAAEGKCLLHLAMDVDSSRFLLMDARSSWAPAPGTLRISFFETLKKGREAFETNSRAGSNWSPAD